MLTEIHDTEREYVHEELDFDYIEMVASAVALALDDGHTIEVAFQPGDWTLYGLVFAPLKEIKTAPPRVAPINGRVQQWGKRACAGVADNIADAYYPGATLISWVDHTCYPLNLANDRPILHPNYIAEHFSIKSATSALTLTLLFREIAARRKVTRQ